MYVIKVQYGEVNRRLVLQEPYTFKSLLQMVTSRYEMNPIQSTNAQLRYVDPDGDLISMNTDAELSEALALLTHSNQGEVQPLRMKLICPEVCCESPGSEDSIVVVDQMEKRFSASNLSDQLKAEQVKREGQDPAEEVTKETAKAAEEAAKAAREAEEKRQFEEEQARIAAEEEEKARAAKIAAEEEEKARLQEEEEKRQRCEIAISAEREDSGKRIVSLMKMGCAIDTLRSIFSADLIDAVVSSSAVQNNLVHEFADCVDSRMDLIDEKAEDVEYEEEPEPTVNWEFQRAMKEQEDKGDSFPSAEQNLAVLEAGKHAQDLATQLTEFYLIHNPEHVAKVPGLVKMYKNRLDELNCALMDRYRCDLSTFRAVAPIQTPIDDTTSIEARLHEDCAPAAMSSQPASSAQAPAPERVAEPVASAPVEATAAPTNERLDNAISMLYEMGIDAPLDRMKSVLEKYDYNLEAAISDLLG